MKLESERLRLRPFVATDLDALTRIYSDAECMRFVGGIRTRDQVREELEATVAGYELHGVGMHAVLTRDDDRLIGRCGLWLQTVDEKSELELGYLVARSAWGHGYATEAARAVRDAAFDGGVRRLISIIDPDNEASIRVALKIGMRLERDIEWRGKLVRICAIAQAPGL